MRKVLGTTALIASLFAATPALACGMYIPSEMNLAEAMEQIEIDEPEALAELEVIEVEAPEVLEAQVVNEATEQALTAEAQEAAELEEARQAMEALRLALEPARADADDASEAAPPAS